MAPAGNFIVPVQDQPRNMTSGGKMNGDATETVADLPLPQIKTRDKTAGDKSAGRWLLLALTAVGMILLAAWSSSGESNAAPAKVPAQMSGAPVEQ